MEMVFQIQEMDSGSRGQRTTIFGVSFQKFQQRFDRILVSYGWFADLQFFRGETEN